MLKSPAPTTTGVWRARLTQVGWVVLPLRLFLGVTMIYAGLLKFFDPAYLDPSSPNGVQQQMQMAAASSPIGFLVSFTADHSTLFGLTIAFGELAVGLGVLLGLWTRVAALGGFLLSLSFFLTVSWGTSPYFFGPDIVFMFAFTPLIVGGDGGVLSLEAAIRTATRRSATTTRRSGEVTTASDDIERRTLLRTGAVAGAIGLGALAVGALGRVVAGSQTASAAPATTDTAGTSTSTVDTTATAAAATTVDTAAQVGGKPKGGKKIGKAADVSVGGVLAFTNPKTNKPAYVLQPKKGTFLAYSAVCTHQGCTVGYDAGSSQFACPCHGARFDASNGDVVRGPAKKPLAKVDVVESNGNLYVV